MARILLVAAAGTLLLAPGCSDPAPQVPPPAAPEERSATAPSESSLRLADGVLENPDALYTLRVPEGWSLNGQSSAQLMVLDRETAAASFSIFVKPAEGGLDAELAGFRQALLGSPFGHTVLEEESVRLGDTPAWRLLSGSRVENVSVRTQNWLVTHGALTYVLGLEAEIETFHQVQPEADAIASSLHFGKAP